MSSQKVIEFVCTANNGRSPVAQLIAENWILDNNTGLYLPASSGTSVDEITKGEVSIEQMISIVNKGLKRDLFDTEERQKFEHLLARSEEYSTTGGDMVALTSLYKKAGDVFHHEEFEYRAEALKKFNLKGEIKKTQDQTVARQDTVAVLSMAGRNNQKVMEIYLGSGNNPIISVLGVFATGNPDAPVPDAYGGTKQDYFKCVETLTNYVPKAMEKLIN